jgi:hypothetical protein
MRRHRACNDLAVQAQDCLARTLCNPLSALLRATSRERRQGTTSSSTTPSTTKAEE